VAGACRTGVCLNVLSATCEPTEVDKTYSTGPAPVPLS
jgi:hypothetical protein